MADNIFIAIPHSTKTVEYSALISKIDNGTLTGGGTLENLVEAKNSKENKSVKLSPYMEAQRDYCWENWRAGNFILASIMHNYIQPILVYHEGEKSNHVKTVDGQQRETTIWKFYNNLIDLNLSKCDVKKFVVNGQEYHIKDFHKKYFKELPEEFQLSFLNHEIDVVTFHNCSDAEAEKIYTAIGRGTKPLKPIEIRKAAMGIDVRQFINNIVNDSWILHTMTSSASNGNMGLDVISQFLTLLNYNKPVGLEKETIDEIIYNFRDFGIPDQVRQNASETSKYLGRVTDLWVDNKKETDKEQVKGRKVKEYSKYRFPFFKNKTFILMFIWAGFKAVQANIEVEVFANWSFKFFQEPSADFKAGLASGSNKAGDLDNVSIRMMAIDDEIEKLKANSSTNNSEQA